MESTHKKPQKNIKKGMSIFDEETGPVDSEPVVKA
jgi:hypothetical protein